MLLRACNPARLDTIIYDVLVEETGSSDGFEQELGRLRLLESTALVSSALAGGVIAALTTPRVTYFLTVPFAVLAICGLVPAQRAEFAPSRGITASAQPDPDHLQDDRGAGSAPTDHQLHGALCSLVSSVGRVRASVDGRPGCTGNPFRAPMGGSDVGDGSRWPLGGRFLERRPNCSSWPLPWWCAVWS